ncbi:hypothetical protein ILUMI_25664 [Ignelater luminosus]|uniref:Dehydrogenase/reductase SDR family member 11 n=1 Tax=Ignelater luminosus TaxID=2038154 RepID=A0A8K0C823_IGNLU|nr:hypothetical protein ILUMI_25664 [Ignelater luminosus]
MASLNRWHGKVAVVTGASQGIGFAIAKRLAQTGLKVVGLARNVEKLEELSKTLDGKLYAVTADITKEEDILKAFEWIKENVGPIHILINSAGVSRLTQLINGSTNLWKDVFDTNILGLCIATREAVKDMRVNNVDGHIIHLNSIAGHKAINLNVYSASKFAVTALTETLRQELNSIGSKIKITSISPGQVKTNILDNSARASGLPELPQQMAELLSKAPALQVEDIVDAIEYVLATPPHVQVCLIIVFL